jgi:hypothetical protein
MFFMLASNLSSKKKVCVYVAEKRGVEIAFKISRYLGLERDSWIRNYICL